MAEPAAFSRSLLITNQRGLHCRAAGRLVETASGFEAEMQILRDDMRADCRSILDLLALGCGQGTWIEVLASGPDAERALEEVSRLISENFGEE